MPLLNISVSEKNAIKQYIEMPHLYLNPMVASQILLADNRLPEGTKVSRAKHTRLNAADSRCYILPSINGSTTRIIPIQKIYAGDPMAHSATLVSGKIYIHQNKNDLPMLLPDNFNDLIDEDDDDSDEDWTEEDKISYREVCEKAYGKINYKLRRNYLGFFNKVVKYAVNEQGEPFYLKSDSSFHHEVVSPLNHAETLAPALYAGPSVFRSASKNGLIETKKISITKDCGMDLADFLQQRKALLDDAAREKLARAILIAYVNQLGNQGIVHTDIKPENICVILTGNESDPFEIMFIDYDESFKISDPTHHAQGTLSYLAKEFFKTDDDFNQRFKQRADDSLLKENWQSYFLQASDLCALGLTLLKDVKPSKQSDLHALARNLCSSKPKKRLEQKPVLQLLAEDSLMTAGFETMSFV